MTEVKEAVSAAAAAAQKFFADKKLIDMQLEEVEMSDDQGFWLITLGFLVPDLTPLSGIETMIHMGEDKYLRKYKVFKVDANTGKVVSMKIREV